MLRKSLGVTGAFALATALLAPINALACGTNSAASSASGGASPFGVTDGHMGALRRSGHSSLPHGPACDSAGRHHATEADRAARRRAGVPRREILVGRDRLATGPRT